MTQLALIAVVALIFTGVISLLIFRFGRSARLHAEATAKATRAEADSSAIEQHLDQARESQTITRNVAETSDEDLRKELGRWSKP